MTLNSAIFLKFLYLQLTRDKSTEIFKKIFFFCFYTLIKAIQGGGNV